MGEGKEIGVGLEQVGAKIVSYQEIKSEEICF